MASTNFTTHYSIPLPLGTDLTTPMDYNEAAEAVDTALFAAETDAGNASEAAAAAVTTANAAADAVDTVAGDLSQEKGKIVALQTRMTNAENEIDDVRADSSDMITAYNEPTATSTHAYAIGDYFIYNNTLYKATAAIAIGATIVPDTNCETTNVSTELTLIKTSLDDITSDASTDIYLRNGLFGDNQVVHAQRIGDYIIASFNGYTDVGGLTAEDFVIGAFSNNLSLEIGNNIGYINSDGSQPHTCTLVVSNVNHNIRCLNPTAGRYFSFETVFKIINE